MTLIKMGGHDRYDNQADDAKTAAAKARKDPLTEKHLKQFLSLESCNAANPAYRRGYDLTFGKLLEIKPVRCKHDGYLATTLQELEWHESQTHHDADHDFEPYVEEEQLPEARIYCTHCGGRHV